MTAPLQAAPAAFDLADLVDLAEAYAPEARRRVRYDRHRRFYDLVDIADDYDVWVIGWCAGQGIDLHDHGGSAGALHVFAGQLVERHRDLSVPDLLTPNRADAAAEVRETLANGTTHAFGAGHVHRLVNPGPHPAASVHVYSPPLSSMTFYDQDTSALHPVATERI